MSTATGISVRYTITEAILGTSTGNVSEEYRTITSTILTTTKRTNSYKEKWEKREREREGGKDKILDSVIKRL